MADKILNQKDLSEDKQFDKLLQELGKECETEVLEEADKTVKGEDLPEPDQFLEDLEKEYGVVKVRQRVANILSPEYPSYNPLHQDLLRLFNKGPVRVVTTNFDLLFEQAAKDLFETLQPNIFEAPTLPLGRRFKGIVHLHGSVTNDKELKEMVLTKRDFGRAYLTEASGWACRFLIDLFSKYTVLFVGYSHTDTIMTYLAQSLQPRDGADKRFALVGRKSNDPSHWRKMGIKFVMFPQEHRLDFSGLNKAVKGFAEFRCRGREGWKREISRETLGNRVLA